MKSETRELSKPTLPQRWLLGRRRPQRQRPVLIFFCRFRLGRHFAIGGTVLRMGPTHQFLIFFLVRCCFLFHRSVYCVCVSTFLRPPPSSSVLVLFLCLVFFFIGRAFSSNFSLALNPPLIFSPRATVLLFFLNSAPFFWLMTMRPSGRTCVCVCVCVCWCACVSPCARA